jgi:DNA-binding NarL/FixJ family response regulator
MSSISLATRPTPIATLNERGETMFPARRGLANPASSRNSARRLVVGIVAAYPSMRAGLGALVQSDVNLTATAIAPAALAAASGMPALAQISDADVILVEPGDLGLATLENLVGLGRDEDVPLLWLGTTGLPETARTSRHAGGVISQDADAETVVAAIHAVQQGLSVFDPNLSQIEFSLRGPSRSSDPLAVASTLSPREREVLELVAAGLPNKAIARALGISDHTVKFHVSSVLTKLDAGSRTEAVTIATRQGILSL